MKYANIRKFKQVRMAANTYDDDRPYQRGGKKRKPRKESHPVWDFKRSIDRQHTGTEAGR